MLDDHFQRVHNLNFFFLSPIIPLQIYWQTLLSDQIDAKSNSSLLTFSTNIYQTTSNCWTHLLWSGQAGLEVRACQPHWSPAGQLIQLQQLSHGGGKASGDTGCEDGHTGVLSPQVRRRTFLLPQASEDMIGCEPVCESINIITIRLQ